MTIKRIILIGIIVFLAVLPFVTYYFRGNPREIAEPKREGPVVYVEDYVERQDELINEEVEKLKKQSLDETFAYLLDDQQYYYPGYQSEVAFVPEDMERILSARGFLKVFQQFEKLPKEQATKKLYEFCERAIKEFEYSLENALWQGANPTLEHHSPKTIRSAKYTVCVSMLLAARMGEHKLLLDQIGKMEPLSETYVNTAKINFPYDNLSDTLIDKLLRGSTYLDDDCILTVLMYAIKRAGIKLESGVLPEIFKQKSIPLCRWDAKLTYYDRLVQRQLATLDPKDVVEEFIVYASSTVELAGPEFFQRKKLAINALKERLSK